MREGWGRQAIERYRLLKKWRDIAGIVAEACIEVLGDECLEVYVVGGAAEGRLTVLSDIDVIVVKAGEVGDYIGTVVAIKAKALELGLPEEAPLDLKILTPGEFKELKSRYYAKTVRIK